eukprot:scaffold4973_cov135-Cylindrotheca_fusiformis.AAC.18
MALVHLSTSPILRSIPTSRASEKNIPYPPSKPARRRRYVPCAGREILLLLLRKESCAWEGRHIDLREEEEEEEIMASEEKPATATSNGVDDDKSKRSVFVGNLDWSVDWQELKDFFNNNGNGAEVVRADVMKTYSGRSKGFGLVEFTTEQAAKEALSLTDQELKGRRIYVREDRGARTSGTEGGGNEGRGGRGRGGRGGGRGGGGRGGNSNGKKNQLYVANISKDTDWRKLKDHFKQVGEVDRANAVPGKFGTVRFFKEEDATKAIEKLNGIELDGSALEVRLDQKA